MPIIGRFLGIVIYMYWRGHVPAHFHAKYQDQESTVDVETGIVKGVMGRRAVSLVQEWREIHKAELLEDGGLAKQKKEPHRIAPLEQLMFLHVKEARHVGDYVIWLRFNDGAEGEMDLEDELEGEVFAPLKDKRNLVRFRADAELETIVWENGADLAPEFLYEKMKVLA